MTVPLRELLLKRMVGPWMDTVPAAVKASQSKQTTKYNHSKMLQSTTTSSSSSSSSGIQCNNARLAGSSAKPPSSFFSLIATEQNHRPPCRVSMRVRSRLSNKSREDMGALTPNSPTPTTYFADANKINPRTFTSAAPEWRPSSDL